MLEHFRHFNAAAVVDAARGWEELLESGGRMMVTLAGAMSTAELGRSLAEMIRQRKVHAITCTGANLEEDLFNLVAHDEYERVPEWRDLTPAQEAELLSRGMNRVTDTCIPEEEAFRRVEGVLIPRWAQAGEAGERRFPHEYLYELLLEGAYENMYQADPEHSWLLAAARAELPIYVPGWEDSTLGNVCAARAMQGVLPSTTMVRSGLEYMQHLATWYQQAAAETPIGFFQIGGGIAGDFPICAVPLIRQDLKRDVPLWAYFCQITDATTSYGGYSGAVANEKITWEKLAPQTPRFMIESDATIVAPLIFAYLLGW
ncbi:MAG: deoxyhypusine synthase family protein [Planctomycetota bacterium]